VVLEGSLALLADGTRVDAGPGKIVYLRPLTSRAEPLRMIDCR
jgi:ethanolamine utilization protein EutQ (cupin superfamily)